MQHQHDTPVLSRLAAFWAFCEAGLGGFLHAFHLPFTGILVSGMSVLSLLMIGRYARAQAIVPAWSAVAAIKFSLSPQSPPTAYLAMSFQALFTGLCLRIIPSFRLASIVAAVVSLAESAAQRILVLTIFFGAALWDSIDRVQFKLFKGYFSENTLQNSHWVIGIYLLIHALAGLWIGGFAASLPAWVESQETPVLPPVATATETIQRRKRWRSGYTIALVLGAWGLYMVVMHIPGGWRMLSGGFAWLLFMTDFVQRKIKRWMTPLIKRISRNNQEKAEQILAALPDVQYAAKYAWEKARAEQRGWSRLPFFIKTTLLVVVKVPGTGIEPARP